MINIICSTNANGCPFTVNSTCITYDGPSTTNIGYVPNMTLTALLLLIDSKFAGISSTVHMDSTSSNLLSGLGISSDPYKFDVKISADTGNTLTLNGDGLFVPTPTVSSINIYNSDGIINGTRTVTITGSSLIFNSASGNSSFHVLQNTTGGSTELLLNITGTQPGAKLISGTSTLLMGQYGTSIKSAVGSLDVSFQGGVKLIRGDDSTLNFSRLTMAPGTSTSPSWIDASAAGNSGVTVASPINFTNGGVTNSCAWIQGVNTITMTTNTTPNRFYINRLHNDDSTNIRLFEVNQDQSIYVSPSLANTKFLAVDSTTKLVPATLMPAIADLVAAPTMADFNNLLAELRTAGLMAL